MAAADTGDVAFAGAALHAEKDLAVGALEVLIVFAVLHTFDELAGLQLPVGGQVDVLPVFFNTLSVVTRKHTEDGCDIEGETDKGEQADAGEAAQNGSHKTGNQGKHTEIIGAMATDHKAGKRFLEALEKVHGKDHPFMNEISIFDRCEMLPTAT